jgi:hypothetical protein
MCITKQPKTKHKKHSSDTDPNHSAINARPEPPGQQMPHQPTMPLQFSICTVIKNPWDGNINPLAGSRVYLLR